MCPRYLADPNTRMCNAKDFLFILFYDFIFILYFTLTAFTLNMNHSTRPRSKFYDRRCALGDTVLMSLISCSSDTF